MKASRNNRRSVVFSSILLLIIVSSPSALMAFSVQQGPTVYVGKGQTIDGNLYAAGTTITIDGRVTGDLVCAGQTMILNGRVEGDILCIGQSITINGSVGGSVRTVGSSIVIDGKIERGLMTAGAGLTLSRDAVVGWDALIGAASAQLNGGVGRSLLGAGANFLLNGPISQDAVLFMNGSEKSERDSRLVVGDSCRIGGSLQYTALNDATIQPGAQIKGKVIHNPLPVEKEQKGTGIGRFIGWLLISLLSVGLVGLVLVSVLGGQAAELTDDMLTRFWPAFGWGVVCTLVTPVVAFMVAITVIGLRLALLSVGVWLICVGLSKILTGIAIGRLLFQKYWPAKRDSLIAATITGTTLCVLVFQIPVLGWVLSLVALWWGMGGLMLYAQRKYAGINHT